MTTTTIHSINDLIRSIDTALAELDVNTTTPALSDTMSLKVLGHLNNDIYELDCRIDDLIAQAQASDDETVAYNLLCDAENLRVQRDEACAVAATYARMI